MATNDPLDPLPNDPPSPPVPSPARERLTCEFCGCLLTPRGHALELSDKARKWRDRADDLEKKDREIETLKTKIRELESEVAKHAPKASTSIFD